MIGLWDARHWYHHCGNFHSLPHLIRRGPLDDVKIAPLKRLVVNVAYAGGKVRYLARACRSKTPTSQRGSRAQFARAMRTLDCVQFVKENGWPDYGAFLKFYSAPFFVIGARLL